MKKSFSLILPILLILGLTACEDDPSSVGQSLLEDQDLTNIYTFETTSSVIKPSYMDSIALGAASRTLIGKTEKLEAIGLWKFYFEVPDSIETEVNADNLNILSSQVTLRPTYWFGEKNAPWGFSAYEVSSTWGSTNFNKDTLNNLIYESTDLSSNLQFVDDTTITFDLDADIAYNWIKFSMNDSTLENEGIIIIPNASTNKIVGFPALTSVVDDDVLPQLSLIVESPGSFVDTLNATLINDAYAVRGDSPDPVENRIMLQSGLTVRSSIMFDVSGLPENSVIVDALLSVYPDSLNSEFGSKGTDTLVVSLLTDFNNNTVEEEDNIYSFQLQNNGNVYQGNIRRYVQYWIDELDNQGMQLKLSDEDRAVTKLAIYDNNISDETLKPRLQIIYTNVK